LLVSLSLYRVDRRLTGGVEAVASALMVDVARRAMVRVELDKTVELKRDILKMVMDLSLDG